MFTVEIQNLRREILDLKNCIKIKETELIKIKIEIERLNKMITTEPHDSQEEKDLTTENNDTKTEDKALERENEVLKVKLKQTDDQTHKQKIETDVPHINTKKGETKYACEKCNLKFSSFVKLKKHESGIHKTMLIF